MGHRPIAHPGASLRLLRAQLGAVQCSATTDSALSCLHQALVICRARAEGVA